MLGATGQFEAEISAERRMDGIQKAKDRGVCFGRKKKLTPEQITELQHRRAQGTLIKTLMQDYSISKVSVYRYLSGAEASLTVVDAQPSFFSGEMQKTRNTRR